MGKAFLLVQGGARLVARWRRPENQESDLLCAIERCNYLYRTSKEFYDGGDSRHGTIMVQALNMLQKIQGLEKVDVTVTQRLSSEDVFERVKQVSARVVAPLVAEKLAQIEEGGIAA